MSRNLLDAKTQALFRQAYGGALEVSLVYDVKLRAHYLHVVVPDYERYAPIITTENLVTLVAGETTPIQSGGGFHFVVSDQSNYHVRWCGIVCGGIFRQSVQDGSWYVEPSYKPHWWDKQDWQAELEHLRQAAKDRQKRDAGPA